MRRTIPQLLNYGTLGDASAMHTGPGRTKWSKDFTYLTANRMNSRAAGWHLRTADSPWWKEMPKYLRPSLRYHWFEPLPVQNYITKKGDGIYGQRQQMIITLQHVIHMRMLPSKLFGRTFHMPLVRWLVGNDMYSLTGNGALRYANPPFFFTSAGEALVPLRCSLTNIPTVRPLATAYRFSFLVETSFRVEKTKKQKYRTEPVFKLTKPKYWEK